jgi:hypothetical protein
MPTNSRASTVLRVAAITLHKSDSYLGAQFRLFRARLGPPVAVKAKARHPPRLPHAALRNEIYRPRTKLYDAQYRKLEVTHLKLKAEARVANH